MHIIITGANGFIGQNLALKILNNFPSLFDGHSLERLTLIDLDFNEPESLYGNINNVRLLKGSFAEIATLSSAVDDLPVDLVFHLASVPSGAAENNYSLGMDVNVHGVYNLLELLRQQHNTPILVFASSIAIYGKPTSEFVDENTQPTPNLSYGSQKVIAETLVSDYTRRGWLQGSSIRLPGIVVRPPAPNGAVSIFFSDLIRNLSQGKAYICPVSKQAKAWLMSVQCCVDNLIHSATIKNNSSNVTWTLPALHLSIEEIVNTIDELYPKVNVHGLISYQPDGWVEDNFGSYPPLHCPNAEAVGLKHDGAVTKLIQQALK